MGQAQSTNYTNTVIDSYARVLQTTTSSAFANSVNEVRIGVEGGKGDVNISNVLSKQTIENDVVASFKQANDSAIVQSVAQEIQQQASSLVSGVNFGSFAESSNTLNTAISASMEVSQDISTTCASTAANVFAINVAGRDGNVNIDNIKIDQEIKNSLQCAGESLNKSVAEQDTSNKVAQTATATAKGLSLDFIGIIFIVIGVIVVAFSVVLKQFIVPGMIVAVFVVIEYLIYSFGLKVVQDKIKIIEKTMADNKKKQKTGVKMPEQIFSVSYSSGLNGLAQGSSGCTYTKETVAATFTSPEAAYNWWLSKPEYKAIDVISRGNGAYDYYFYSNVSEDCKTALNDAPKTIPPIVCGVADPVDNISGAPANAEDNTFLFTKGGLAYCKLNGKWEQLNTQSAFTAATKDNIKIFTTPSPFETGEAEIETASEISGTFYYIDASTARASGGNPTNDAYYFTIDSFDIGSTPVKKFKLSKANYKSSVEADITNLVKTKKVGPFMPNPKMSDRSYTSIWDSTEQTADDQNKQMLADEKKNEKNYQIAMGVVGGVGALVVVGALIYASKPAPK